MQAKTPGGRRSFPIRRSRGSGSASRIASTRLNWRRGTRSNERSGSPAAGLSAVRRTGAWPDRSSPSTTSWRGMRAVKPSRRQAPLGARLLSRPSVGRDRKRLWCQPRCGARRPPRSFGAAAHRPSIQVGGSTAHEANCNFCRRAGCRGWIGHRACGRHGRCADGISRLCPAPDQHRVERQVDRGQRRLAIGRRHDPVDGDGRQGHGADARAPESRRDIPAGVRRCSEPSRRSERSRRTGFARVRRRRRKGRQHCADDAAARQLRRARHQRSQPDEVAEGAVHGDAGSVAGVAAEAQCDGCLDRVRLQKPKRRSATARSCASRTTATSCT